MGRVVSLDLDVRPAEPCELHEWSGGAGEALVGITDALLDFILFRYTG